MKTTWVLAAGLLAGPALSAPVAEKAPPDAFRKAALKNGSRYLYDPMKALVDVPADSERTEPKKNDDIAYQFAFKEKGGRFEIRVRFDPLTETSARHTERAECAAKNKKEAGSCMMTDLDAPSAVWAEGLTGNMTEEEVRYFPFPDDGVKKEFAADWGFVSSPFDLDPKRRFNDGYALGQVIVINKRGVGRIFQITLANDIVTLKTLGHSIYFYSARFQGSRPPEPAGR